VARLINTFDVFDTLIARRGVEPRCVLDRLQSRGQLPGLAAARLATDRQLWAQGKPYSLHDIYQEVRCLLSLDEPSADRLLQLEIELEHDEVIPIAENLEQVQDGDLLISDTYLPAEVVVSLLRRAGLDRRVAIVVSNDGKSRGWI
jgi:predicted HAD superfamily hydrolase